MVPNSCSFPDCKSPIKVKSLALCGGHYAQHSKGRALTEIVKYSPTCSFGDCGERSHGLGLCKKHWQRKNQGRPLEDATTARDMPCSVGGCPEPSKVRGWCGKHYARWQRTGNPEAVRRILGNDLMRAESKIDFTGQCHNWTGTLDANGYGAFRVNGKTVKAHRFMFEQARGTIPAGIVLDHICHNRACVNPAHLRFATDKQNGENRGVVNSNNRSGVRGVHWVKEANKWDARVMHHRKHYLAGRFDRLEDAEEAVRLLRNKLFTYNDSDRNQK